ncbi:MAG: threonylcarbamoyl-AMP synthase [Deltaproteobacteria bacterium]|nr:threonylcarbamoyl-AMP synthase [Deltaproteobacteria bacterium]
MAAREIDAALAMLRRGGAVVYPTETFYGLGARALSYEAVAGIARLKGRDAGKPIALVVADAGMLGRVVAHVPAPARRLVDAFWPGPLTLVMPAHADLPPALTGGTGMIGVRVSSHPIARALVTALGEPLTATSANPGGAGPALDVAEARGYFGDAVAYVDGGRLAGGLGSTVLLVVGDAARVIRRGATPIDALRGVLGTTPLSNV